MRVKEGFGEQLRTTYDRLLPPGDKVKLDIRGRKGKRVEVLIEDEVVYKTQL